MSDNNLSRSRLSTALSETISGQDLGDARAYFDLQLKDGIKQLEQLNGCEASAIEKANVQLQIARAQLGLQLHHEAWQTAFALLELFVQHDEFEKAVETAELLYLSDQPESTKALAHASWLAITYPVDPALSTDILAYIVDETPDDSDGAAVAAVMAYYLVELRAQGVQRDNLLFLAKQIIAKVAKRHRGIDDEEAISIWIEMHQLNDLDELFTRMAKILDAIVENGEWWIDRDALRERLPVN